MKLSLGHSERESGDEVRLTGYTLWDRVLSDRELLDNARSCQEVQGTPVVSWNDFYQVAQTKIRKYLVIPSECNVQG